MRYYSIVITDPTSGNVIAPDPATRVLRPSASAKVTYASYDPVVGSTLAGALDIELDIPVAPYANPIGAAYVRIRGVSLQEIGQASNLNGKQIAVYAGMRAGLPLANPNQSGLIVKGYVQQGFGNWQMTEQSIDLIVAAGIGSADAPKNLSFQWKAGTQLGTAIKNTLLTGFPGYTANVNVSQNLVIASDETGYYQTVEQLADYLKGISKDVIGGDYQGVDVVLKENAFEVYDGTTPTTPKQIDFTDLVGQPTWIEPLTIQVRTVMRADVAVGDYIKLPPGLVVTTTSQSLSQYRDGSVFQGSFQVSAERHTGSFRQPDGDSWVTTFNAFPSLKAA